MKKGFTILEMMVVLSVIIIIIGIGVPRFKGMREEANLKRVRSELKTLQIATESYYNSNNNYPPSTGGVEVQSTYLIPSTPQIISTVLKDRFNQGADTLYPYQYSDSGGSGDGEYYIWYSLGYSSSGTSSGVSYAGNGVFTVGSGVVCVSNARGC